MPRLIYRPANEDAPRPVLEDDAPPALRIVRADRLSVCPQAEDDTPILGLALVEDDAQTMPLPKIFTPKSSVTAQDDDLPVAAAAPAFEDDAQTRPLSQGTLAILRPFPVDDDLPVTSAAALVFEEDSPARPLSIPWAAARPGPPEDDAPVLYGAFEEDSWRAPGAQIRALQPPLAPVAEDVPALHGIFEDDRFVLGVPPRADWRWWPGPPDSDWGPVPAGHVPSRAGLLLVAQNREGLALQRVAAMQLVLAPSGRLTLALVRSAASQLSLSPVGRLNLSLARSG